jgi:DNA-binding NtrC family response regulator
MGSDIKILVVDDDHYLLDLLIETLKTIGYNAVGVSRPQEALTMLKTDKFELVITDIKMPDMDGIEFSRRVKENHPDLPVIFISGVLGSSLLHGSEAEGFLAKPFRIGQMEELIENVISGLSKEDDSPASERILVVDDDDTFRLMLLETLKLSGFAVAGARDGQEAISLLHQGGISAVISDFKMPGMDGISLTGQIKKSWPTIPVIMITGYLSSEDDPLRPENVADGFLMKPFKIESITELLENLKNQQTPG